MRLRYEHQRRFPDRELPKPKPHPSAGVTGTPTLSRASAPDSTSRFGSLGRKAGSRTAEDSGSPDGEKKDKKRFGTTKDKSHRLSMQFGKKE